MSDPPEIESDDPTLAHSLDGIPVAGPAPSHESDNALTPDTPEQPEPETALEAMTGDPLAPAPYLSASERARRLQRPQSWWGKASLSMGAVVLIFQIAIVIAADNVDAGLTTGVMVVMMAGFISNLIGLTWGLVGCYQPDHARGCAIAGIVINAVPLTCLLGPVIEIVIRIYLFLVFGA